MNNAVDGNPVPTPLPGSSVMVVLSGGQDSTTCLLEAKRQYETVHAITFDYGQRHKIEIQSAVNVAALVGVDSHEVVNVAGLLRSTSPLTSDTALETYTSFEQMDGVIGNRVELTFVPLRNPFFLIVAANYALAKGCHTLMTGVCGQDNANYPDCTYFFIRSIKHMINAALGVLDPDTNWPRRGVEEFKIETPLLHLTKAETVRLAMSHGALGCQAIALSHTCYAGVFPPCGVCHACTLRAEGFRVAGVADPLAERGEMFKASMRPAGVVLSDEQCRAVDEMGGML